MGPEVYCPVCEGRHPEALHYTLRGILAPEPAFAPRDADKDEFASAAGHPAAGDTAAMSAPSRDAEMRHGPGTL